ncbi:unnamed protein product, partial [Bubo scandiacus]
RRGKRRQPRGSPGPAAGPAGLRSGGTGSRGANETPPNKALAVTAKGGGGRAPPRAGRALPSVPARRPRPGLTAARRNVFPGRGKRGRARRTFPSLSLSLPSLPSPPPPRWAPPQQLGGDGQPDAERSEAGCPAAPSPAQPGPARSRDGGAEGELRAARRAGARPLPGARRAAAMAE